MKKCLTILFFIMLCVQAALAQTNPRLQIIHNAAGLDLDTIDVYINNVKINNFRFRHSTPRLIYSAGNYKININHRSSTDSGNQVLFSRTINLQNGDRLVIMIQGVENPANYASNPLGKSTNLSINVTNLAARPTNNSVSYNFLNGITDSRQLNFYPRNLAQVFTDIEYTIYNNSFTSINTSINSNFTNTPKIFNLTSSDNETIYSSKQFPIQNSNFLNNNVVFVASGFINPANNNNRPKAELFAVDSVGGPFIKGTIPTRTAIQIIHNSPDVLLDTIDIYINNTKYNNIAFRAALPLLNLIPGNYNINFNHKNSNDSSDGVWLRYKLQLDTGLTYTLFLKGVFNPQQYFPNASNISTALSIHKISTDYDNRGLSNRTQLMFINGNFDSKHNDFYVDGTSFFPVLFGSENKLLGAAPLSTGISSRISIHNGDGFILKPHILPNSSLASQLSFIFSSGFVFPNQINPPGKQLALMVADSSGRVQQLNPALSAVQFIHNSADVSMDTVDVYFDNVKIENIAFRESSGTIFVNEGSYVVNINHKGSVDSSHLAIARIPVNVTANTSITNRKSIYMLMGVSNPDLYARMPGNTFSTALRLVKSDNIPTGNSIANVNEIIFHGVTDLDRITTNTFPTANSLEIPFDSSFTYTRATLFSTTPALETYLSSRPWFSNQNRGYHIPLQQFGGKTIVLFYSGFSNPSANQNGKPYGLFVVDSARGPAIQFQEACRRQFIHATSDTSVGNIDIWQGEKRIVNNLKPNQITPTITLFTSDTVLHVTKSGAAHSNDQRLLTDSQSFIHSGNTHYTILSGWLDTSAIEKTPTGISTKLSFNHQTFNEQGPSSGNFRLAYFNAVPDADSINLLRIRSTFYSQTSLYNLKIPYKGFTSQTFGFFSDISGALELLEVIKADTNRAFRFRVQNSFIGKNALLFTSGTKNDLNTPYFIAFNDGSLFELPPLLANLQFIHASADISLKQIDVYANGIKVANAIKYPSATPLINLAAKRRTHIRITNANNLSDSTALLSFNFKPDTAQRFHAVLNGVLNPNIFQANPEGINTLLNIALDTSFRVTASNSNNVDLKFFNAATNTRKVNARAQSNQTFLGFSNAYKTFRNYTPHSASNNTIINVTESGIDTSIHAAEASLLPHRGKAGIAILHGFINPTNNLNANPLGIFIAWPDGSIDTLRKTTITTGLQHINNNLFQGITAALYPNPANTASNLFINAKQNTAANIKLLDINGKCVLNQSIQLHTGENNVIIQINSINNGMYFCLIEHEYGQLVLKLAVTK